MVCGKEAQYIQVVIATSGNQIVLPKFLESTKILYYIHQIPLSSWRVEGGSGDKTTTLAALAGETTGICIKHLSQPLALLCIMIVYIGIFLKPLACEW